ncbi:MAG TPA: hypothetical protein VER03_20080, partial [Bryobacteraceae bacterium]|nr:hypothetical protein [Bryobacteraceae bacterium]
ALHIWIAGGREVSYYCGAVAPVTGSIAPDWVGNVANNLVCAECMRRMELKHQGEGNLVTSHHG